MGKCLVLALAAGALHAAVIHGTVVENQTGHALARTLVSLRPVAGTAGPSVAIRTNSYGIFEFQAIPAGSYLITASRSGFVTVQYGQRQSKASGVPLVVAENDSPNLAIRLPRFGAIMGTVLDENDVGLQEYDVVAYRNTRPPRLVAHAKSDDRGVYRLHGLEAGSYLVRGAGKLYEEGGYLPTFSKETQIVEQAYPVDVDFDREVDRVDVRPTPGRLYTLDVTVVTVPPVPPLPVTLTLVSDMGRETVQSSRYGFGPLPPGQYEVFAQAPVDRRTGIQGEYRRVSVGQDTQITIVLRQVLDLQFTFEGAPAGPVQVLGRKKDLAGESAPEVLKLVNNRIQLAPGPWELAIAPAPNFYVSGFSGPRYQRPGDARAEGWNEILVGGDPTVRFALSQKPGAVRGSVKSGSDPVAGAPVFLEPLDLEPRRRVTDPFVTRTDIQGQYRFSGLAPGNYRVLSSFEYRTPDSQTMSNAGAKVLRVDEGREAEQDLELYVAR